VISIPLTPHPSLLVVASLLGACVEPTRSQVPDAPLSTAAPRVVEDETVSRASIYAVLDDWHAAAASADEKRYFSHLADDSIFLGTDATERWDKAAFLAYSKPVFAKGKAWSFKAKRRDVLFDGPDYAHFDEELETEGLGPARGSGVLARRDGRWLILHYNLTITVPNERFDATKEAATTARILESKADALADLAFLTGSWIGTSSTGMAVEEHWTHASGGTLIGSGRTTKAGKTVFFEHLRIEIAKDGATVYFGQPLGKPATQFRRVATTAKNEAIFENKKHDWPKRLTYRLEDKNLSVRIEGDPKQRVESWTMEPAIVHRGK